MEMFRQSKSDLVNDAEMLGILLSGPEMWTQHCNSASRPFKPAFDNIGEYSDEMGDLRVFSKTVSCFCVYYAVDRILPNDRQDSVLLSLRRTALRSLIAEVIVHDSPDNKQKERLADKSPQIIIINWNDARGRTYKDVEVLLNHVYLEAVNRATAEYADGERASQLGNGLPSLNVGVEFTPW